jgi:hypothetical protein
VWLDLLELARQRSGAHQNRHDRRVDIRRSDSGIDRDGILYEWAACQYLDLPLTNVRAVGRTVDDGSKDEVWYGKRLQVKGTRYPSGKLLFGGPLKEMTADLALLVVGVGQWPKDEPPTLRIAGWCTREKFEKHRVWETLQRMACWTMLQGRLNDPQLLHHFDGSPYLRRQITMAALPKQCERCPDLSPPDPWNRCVLCTPPSLFKVPA